MRYVLGSSMLVAALLAAPAFAEPSPVIGAWTTTVDIPQGAVTVTMTFAEKAGVYSVTFDDPPAAAGAPIADLVVKDAAFSFKRTVSLGDGLAPIQLTYEGTVDGDKLTATATSSFGPVPITGTRKK
jgi:hypothetical protein